MQVETTRLYRVRAVAELLDISVATIYRAVDTGALRAVRLGVGKGAVRIPGVAIEEYVAVCERAAATSRPVGDGVPCAICHLADLTAQWRSDQGPVAQGGVK